MTDYLITGLKKKKKSFIEKELEKIKEKGTWYKYYTKNKDLKLILKSALKKLKKKLCLNALACNPNKQEADWKCSNCMAIEEVLGRIEE